MFEFLLLYFSSDLRIAAFITCLCYFLLHHIMMNFSFDFILRFINRNPLFRNVIIFTYWSTYFLKSYFASTSSLIAYVSFSLAISFLLVIAGMCGLSIIDDILPKAFLLLKYVLIEVIIMILIMKFLLPRRGAACVNTRI